MTTMTAPVQSAGPKLPAFHKLPEKPVEVKLETHVLDDLKAYAAFYSDKHGRGVKVDPEEVAAQMIEAFMADDPAFAEWKQDNGGKLGRRRRSAKAGA